MALDARLRKVHFILQESGNNQQVSLFFDFIYFLDFAYLFTLVRGEGKEKERERNIDVREKH